jgi:ferric iron reductase protein FhuF
MGVSYRPGDIVPTSGVYRIEHYRHRLMHEATLVQGTRFPLCRTCKTRVRFSLVCTVRGKIIPFRSTEILEEYPDVEANGQAAG